MLVPNFKLGLAALALKLAVAQCPREGADGKLASAGRGDTLSRPIEAMRVLIESALNWR